MKKCDVELCRNHNVFEDNHCEEEANVKYCEYYTGAEILPENEEKILQTHCQECADRLKALRQKRDSKTKG